MLPSLLPLSQSWKMTLIEAAQIILLKTITPESDCSCWMETPTLTTSTPTTLTGTTDPDITSPHKVIKLT
ncbi:hypothetical protein E3U43_003683 [Larimichthys crocea]|uniref:Uncharacterized protein n=1 Tax=Larimichthys crocea TaxID=215358 RepID=A0ACD3RJ23_LARCR|nr:hypothetical protein E3U43_003683 [Larimichthys crocea]